MNSQPPPSDLSASKAAAPLHPSYSDMISVLVDQMSASVEGANCEYSTKISEAFQDYTALLTQSISPPSIEQNRALILLSRDGLVVEINNSSISRFELNLGESLQSLASPRTSFDALFGTKSTTGQASLLFLTDRNNQPVTMIGLSDENENRVVLVEVDHGWPTGLRSGLEKSYGLTKRECEILESICSGSGSSEIAEISQRKVSTIRQQIKSILTKLEVNSQAQAVALVTSILVTMVKLNPADQGNFSLPPSYTISGATGKVGVVRYGLRGGTPVLLFHGALFGVASKPEDVTKANLIGLDIIAPHREGYGETGINKNRNSVVENCAKNALAALDDANISKAVLLAHDIGCAYAFTFAQKYPDRVAGIVCGPTTPPMHNWEQTDHMPVRHRVSAWAAQKLPAIMDSLVSLGLTHIGRKGIKVIPEYVFADCVFDREIWQQSEHDLSISKSFSLVQQQNGTGFKFDLYLTNSDWSSVARETTCPAIFFHGVNNQTVSAEAVKGLAESLSGAELVLVENAGHTLPITHGASLFRAVSRLGVLAGL